MHHHQALPCKQRPPGLVRGNIYAFAKVSFSFSPSVLISPYLVTLSRMRGADGHAALVVGIVVVIAAVRIDIVEIVVVIGRPQPPPRGAGRIQKLT